MNVISIQSECTLLLNSAVNGVIMAWENDSTLVDKLGWRSLDVGSKMINASW